MVRNDNACGGFRRSGGRDAPERQKLGERKGRQIVAACCGPGSGTLLQPAHQTRAGSGAFGLSVGALRWRLHLFGRAPFDRP